MAFGTTANVWRKRKSKQITRPPRMEWSFKSSSDEALKRGTPKSRMSPLFSLLRKDFFKLSPIGGRFPWLKFLGFTITTYYSPRKTKIAHSKVIVGRLIAFLLKCFLFWRILVHFRQGGWKLSHIKTLSNCLFHLLIFEYLTKKLKRSVETHAWALKKKTSKSRIQTGVSVPTKRHASLHRISFSPGWNQSWRSQIQTFTWRPACWRFDLKTRGGVVCLLCGFQTKTLSLGYRRIIPGLVSVVKNHG